MIPEFVDVDIIAGALNKKLAHCKAWFTTSKNSYITFEVSAGKSEGVIDYKYGIYGSGSQKKSNSTV